MYGIRCLKVDNTAFPHPVRCKLRLHYARLTAGGIVDLQANLRVALQHLSVGSHLATRNLSQCLGWHELATLKHHATCFQASLGCSLCLPTLPIRQVTHARRKSSNKFGFRSLTCNFPPLAGNYFCDEGLSVCIADFNAYNSNIKETPAVSKSQRKSLLFGGHCARYVQTQYGNYLFLKLPYAVRSAAPDKQQKGLKWQVCDGRGMLQSNSRAEGTND